MSDEKTTERDERKEEVEEQAPPIPERSTDKKPHPSKGEGRRGNVQLPPDEQRGKPDPKRG